MARSGKSGPKLGADTQLSSVKQRVNGEVTSSDLAEDQSAKPGTESRPQLSSEARAKLAEMRGRLEVRVGQLVLMLMNIPRYRHQTIADLHHLIIEPLLFDRLAIAHAKTDSENAASEGGGGVPVGVAIWASVDKATDEKIKEQVKGGSFPVRLSGNEWSSGEKIWLLDVVAPNRDAASAVLVNFGKIAGERPVQLHPIVGRMVEPRLLDKLKRI